MSGETIQAVPAIQVEATVTNWPEQPKTKYRRRAATLTTILISASNPVQKLLPMSPHRCQAFAINYTDADIVICSSESVAVRVSQLADFTEQVDGTLVPKTVGSAMPVPLDTTDDLWVTSNSTAIAAAIIRVGVLDYVYAEN
jgi:hypothetical protein